MPIFVNKYKKIMQTVSPSASADFLDYFALRHAEASVSECKGESLRRYSVRPGEGEGRGVFSIMEGRRGVARTVVPGGGGGGLSGVGDEVRDVGKPRGV